MNFPRPSTAGVFFALSNKMTEAITTAAGSAKWYLLNPSGKVRLRNSVGFHAALAQLIDALMERIVVPCQLTNSSVAPSNLHTADFGSTYYPEQSKFQNLLGDSLSGTLANHLTRAKIGKETRFAPFEFWRDLFKSCREVGIMTGPVTLTASDGKKVKVYPPTLPPLKKQDEWGTSWYIWPVSSTAWKSETETSDKVFYIDTVDSPQIFNGGASHLPSGAFITHDFLAQILKDMGVPSDFSFPYEAEYIDFCEDIATTLWMEFNGYDPWYFIEGGTEGEYPFSPHWIDGTVSRRASLTAMQLYQLWLSLMWANWAELGLSVTIQHEHKKRTVVYDVRYDGTLTVKFDNTETTPLTKTNIIRWERGISYDCQPSSGSFPNRSGIVYFDFYVPDISWNAMHPGGVPSLSDEYYNTPGYVRFQAAEQAYYSLKSTAWQFQHQDGDYCLVYIWVGQDDPVTRLTDNGSDTIDFIRDTMRDTGVTNPRVRFYYSDASGARYGEWYSYEVAMEAANYLAVINEDNAAYAADDGVGVDVTDKLMENYEVKWIWGDGSERSDPPPPPPFPSVTLTVTAYALNPEGAPTIPASTFTPKFSPSTSSSTGNPVWPAYDYIQAGYVASENVAFALKFHECLADHRLVSGAFVQGRNISNFDIFQLKVGGSVGTVTEATPGVVAADMLADNELLPAVEEFPMPAGSFYQYPSQLPTMRMVPPEVYATGFSATLPEGYDDWRGHLPLPLTAWFNPNKSRQTAGGDWLPYKITDSSNRTVWQDTGSDNASFSIGFEIDGGGSLQSAEAADFGDYGAEWAQLDISAKCGLRAVWNWKSMPCNFT